MLVITIWRKEVETLSAVLAFSIRIRFSSTHNQHSVLVILQFPLKYHLPGFYHDANCHCHNWFTKPGMPSGQANSSSTRLNCTFPSLHHFVRSTIVHVDGHPTCGGCCGAEVQHSIWVQILDFLAREGWQLLCVCVFYISDLCIVCWNFVHI